VLVCLSVFAPPPVDDISTLIVFRMIKGKLSLRFRFLCMCFFINSSQFVSVEIVFLCLCIVYFLMFFCEFACQ